MYALARCQHPYHVENIQILQLSNVGKDNRDWETGWELTALLAYIGAAHR